MDLFHDPHSLPQFLWFHTFCCCCCCCCCYFFLFIIFFFNPLVVWLNFFFTVLIKKHVETLICLQVCKHFLSEICTLWMIMVHLLVILMRICLEFQVRTLVEECVHTFLLWLTPIWASIRFLAFSVLFFINAVFIFFHFLGLTLIHSLSSLSSTL